MDRYLLSNVPHIVDLQSIKDWRSDTANANRGLGLLR